MLQKGLNLNPKHEYLLVSYAHLLLLSHNSADGYDYVLKILEINPKNQWALSSRKKINETVKSMRNKLG